jgi:hypothetical protein
MLDIAMTASLTGGCGQGRVFAETSTRPALLTLHDLIWRCQADVLLFLLSRAVLLQC